MHAPHPAGNRSIDERAALEALLHVLVDQCEVDADDEWLARAAREGVGDEPLARLSTAGSAVGLRIRVVRAESAEVLPHARLDLPIVGHGEEGWFLVDRYVLGRVRLRRIGDPRPPRWVPAGSVPRPGDAVWGFVEPALPASPLLPRAGQGRMQPLDRLRALLRVERQDIGIVVLYAVAIGVLTLATPLAVQVLINWLAFGALLQPIIVLSALLLLFLTLAAGLRALQRWTVEIVQRRIFVRMVGDLSERLLRARVEAFDGAYGPELVNRFFDVFTVQKAVSTLLLDGVTAGLQAAVGLLLLALYHPVLLVFDVVIVLAMTAIVFLGRGAQDTAIDESKVKYAVAGWLEEIALHPLVFKQGGDALALDRADRLARTYLRSRDRHFRVFFRQYVGVQVVQVGVSAALLLLCGWLVLEGELTLGQLVAAEFIVTAALAGFGKFAEKLDTLYDLLAGVDKLGTLVDLPQEERTGIVRPASDAPAAVGLHDVSYRWSGHDGGLAGIELELAAGERVAVHGRPGAGKSMLAELVAGTRRPTRGAVTRDGLDLTVLRPDRVHAEVAVVRSGGVVQATVLDNLTLGREIPETEVWEVLRRVGLQPELARLPAKLRTEIGPAGTPSSEVRTAALLVARAMLARPRLLVVDGVLDGMTEEAREPLLRALTAADAPWTLLVTTDDRALADRLDRTLYLVDGGLRERPALRPL